MSTKVPAPWTPVEFKLSGTYAEASVWGRTYIWDGTLLPSVIRTVDREILSAPASMHASFVGKETWASLVVKNEEPFTEISYTPVSCEEDKAVFIVGATAGNILVNIRYTIEYDGYVEMALSVIPFWAYAGNGENMPRLNGLYFDFPLTGESSDFFHFWPNGSNGLIPDPAVMGSGKVPAEGVTCPFKPYFWAGWEFGGLGIAIESEENVQLEPGTPAIRLMNTENGRVLRWTLLDKIPRQWYGKVDHWEDALAPIDYVFGIQATPVKPLTEERLNTRIVHGNFERTDYLFELDENGEKLIDKLADAGTNWVIFHEDWSSMQNYGQAFDEERFKAYVDACHARGMKVMAYYGYEYPTNAPDWHEKRDEYLIKTPRGNYAGGWQRMNPCQRDYMVCYDGAYGEKLRERVKFAMDYYHIDGIYTDSMYTPWECANANHGCGYTDENGVRHATFPIFGLRKHVKALYELVHSYGGIIDTHQSACMVAPTLAFTDGLYNGESIQGKLSEDFLGFLSLPAYRTEFTGKNLGVPVQMLAYTNENMSFQKVASLSMIHDVLTRPSMKAADVAYLAPIWKKVSEFETSKAVWHPYWIDDGLVKSETENAYTSVYEKDGKYLAVVSSFKETTDEVSFVFSGNVKLCGNVPGDAVVTAEGNRMTLKIKPFNVELVEFTLA